MKLWEGVPGLFAILDGGEEPAYYLPAPKLTRPPALTPAEIEENKQFVQEIEAKLAAMREKRNLRALEQYRKVSELQADQEPPEWLKNVS